MIRDKLVPTVPEITRNHSKQTRSYKLLVDEALIAKLEEQKVQLNTVSVKVLNLSGRASTRLKIANINSIDQLINCSEYTLLNIPHVGITIVEEIKSKLNLYLSKELNNSNSRLFNRINAADVKEPTYSPSNIILKLLKRFRHGS
jgi:DNA-directed RNA polymerase alpha subunit